MLAPLPRRAADRVLRLPFYYFSSFFGPLAWFVTDVDIYIFYIHKYTSFSSLGLTTVYL